jgi:rSAM/selenodomain-associated transferase 2
VIVVNGGSTDRTREIAEAAGALVLESPAGRGLQLAFGAREARGDWLVFLHADTRLEQGWAGVLEGLPPEVVGGAFRLAIDSPRKRYRLVERCVALRCRLLRLAYGDQGIFVRRRVYGNIGGFSPLPLMEDVDFMRRLVQAGPVSFPPLRAFTSPRRWERHGLLATTLSNWWILGLYALGRPAGELAKLYEGRA